MSDARRIWGIVLTPKSAEADARGRGMLGDLHRRGRWHIDSIRAERIYFFRGRLDREVIDRLGRELLVDPVVETYRVFEGMDDADRVLPSVEVHYQAGVMDPAAGTVLRTAKRLLDGWGVCVSEPGASATGQDAASRQTTGSAAQAIGPALVLGVLNEVRTAWRYSIVGCRGADELTWIARSVLANECIETPYVDGYGVSAKRPADFPQAPVTPFEKRIISIRGLNDTSLSQLSRRGHLFLSLAEMKAIQSHYEAMGRDPTDIELETFAQTWSEHCVHKTLKSAITYRGADFGRDGDVEVRFDNLLKETIVAATRRLNHEWCLSVFEDNAGVIAFDDEYGVAFKVETHNHPSAIEPYGGAATGVGGCIRDVIGCGLGAKPIASTDVFCLAPPDWPEERLPRGVLHPRRVLTGVVSGVRDYGNRMGIPTVNGAIQFGPRYLTNPLVFCGCVGLLPRNRIAKAAREGDCIVLVGGRTGRDGIHGATFSSSELTDSHIDEFSHAVQIGNAIEEKKVLDAVLAARDHEGGCLFNSITDCGAGGLSSAVGEMGEKLGASVDLDRVPLKYAGLRYDEIWISEAQERMVLAVAEVNLDELLRVFAGEEVEATVIGRFKGDKVLTLRYAGTVVGEIDLRFLHEGLPRVSRVAEWTKKTSKRRNVETSKGETESGLRTVLLNALGNLNIASKEWVIRQYDHEVQGCSVVKPLVGVGSGPSDGAVLRPRLDSERGIALGCGLCPEESDVDPYEMAISAVDEALRNVVSVGGDPERTAILDNFCWGEVESPRSLGALVRACRGAYDVAMAYGLPFISGKDSLNNHFSQGEEEAARLGMPPRVSIPDTLLISAISVVADVKRCVTMDLKAAGNRLVCVWPRTQDDLSVLAAVHRRVAHWIAAGWVVAAHDVSDGGLAVALAEMCIAGDCGAELNLDGFECDARDDSWLFARRRCCYVLEITVGAKLDDPALVTIGRVDAGASMIVRRDGRTIAEVGVEAMREAWRRPLSAVGGV